MTKPLPGKDYSSSAVQSSVVYLYDGSFEGLLSCVFESFSLREIPANILFQETEQIPLNPVRQIETNLFHAERVARSISKKISPEAEELIRLSFLTCLPDKEILILRFFYLGYQYRRSVLDRLTDDTVNALFKGVKHLRNEVHLLKGFIRFSIHNNILLSVINPKNFILPLLKDHFCQRYPNEAFMIYDQGHGMALVYRPFESAIIPIDQFEMAEPDEEEAAYQNLWKLFYDTIAIEGRYNPKCRMSHMPKRYWKYMTEFTVPGKVNSQSLLENSSTHSDFVNSL